MRTLGQFQKQKLIERYGADMRQPDLREEIAQCKRHGKMQDACVACDVDLTPRGGSWPARTIS